MNKPEIQNKSFIENAVLRPKLLSAELRVPAAAKLTEGVT
jgi:hypothetical protein